MAFLPEDVRSQQRVLGLVVLLGAAILFVLHVLVPRREAAADLRQRIGELEHRNRGAGNGTEEVGATRSELTQAERRLKAFREMVPRDPDLADIYEEVAARSEALGLELVSIDPGLRERVDGGCCRRVRWEVVLEGQYHDLGDFLTRFASLPRIVRPSVRSIGGLERTAEGRYPVRAEVVLESYVLGEGNGAEPGVARRDASTAPSADTPRIARRARFAYPVGDRPNPFHPPTTSASAGPRFEDLRLSGILYGADTASVAVLREAGTGRLHRMRPGDRLGDARLVEVRPTEVHFLVPGPAGSRRELLRVEGGGEPGGSR